MKVRQVPEWLAIVDGEAKTFFGANHTLRLFLGGAMVFRAVDKDGILVYKRITSERDIYDTP